MDFLLNNIRQQIAVMHSMDKQPTKLVCDTDSFNALMDEVVLLMPVLIPAGPTKIYGLEIELSRTPNFEVV